MRSNLDSLTLSISRKEGVELRNQILKLAGGSLSLVPDMRGTPLADLLELLEGNFEATHPGVNYLPRS